MIRVENLSVNYGHITALEDVSFRIERGEIVTLIGSNGAGKTTSLMAISGLVLKKAGRVFFEDTDITDMAPDKIVRLGVCHVPEGRKVFPALTVYENLIAGTVGNPGMKKKQIAEQLEKVYDLFPRLKERRSQDGGTLSIADRGYVLENGRVVLTGAGKDLISNADVQKAYLGI